MSEETLDLKISLIEDPLIRGGHGENVMALLGSLKNVIALWRSITRLQKRYCVMRSFWERYYVIGTHKV